MTSFNSLGENKEQSSFQCVVRVSISTYKRGNDIVYERSLRLRKRLSSLDLTDIGIDVSLDNVVNLLECAEGLYKCVPCNHRYDVETGVCDDWDIRLVPYTED